ncbi:hypothetical protein L227DRAFT_643874 [Lentinus tigrinus ALCF2SS1-6]|uniref:Uncharacterized protein n=1 Tax=Lentinus tigrinus ALCF2SS1-6 TaxID=1328759 RepID=A0A5C2RP83_9APHY|nr:hypothetical protein L227DRAFT_643874 [Lentinus tigrinus ALCF2SS1-6]
MAWWQRWQPRSVPTNVSALSPGSGQRLRSYGHLPPEHVSDIARWQRWQVNFSVDFHRIAMKAVEVPDGDKRLEARGLAGANLLLHGHNLHDLVLTRSTLTFSTHSRRGVDRVVREADMEGVSRDGERLEVRRGRVRDSYVEVRCVGERDETLLALWWFATSTSSLAMATR